MALAPGMRLGPYTVEAPIGAGGMGEVYRARDTRLKRDVALKVLPDSVAQDRDRLARFEREAEILASLNHPNIAVIHGIEESNGTQALVMELVDGQTLADRIVQGPLPLDEALPIARQIAEALEAAHESGIIHRDLKPANIKLRADGAIKVLDFGLAKALESPGGSVTHPALPTITSPTMPFDWRSGHPEQRRGVTQAGIILGTAAYMSPEQARGKPVDKRADIWAFGCVLYEMLTGRRAFPGDDIGSTLARVLEREPDVAALPPHAPAAVKELLARTLLKDPRARLRDIGEARIAIDDFLGGRRDVAAPGRRFRWQWAGALVATAVLAIVALAARGLVQRQPTAPSWRVDLALPPGDELDTRWGRNLAVAPDDRSVVYKAVRNGRSRLFLRPLDDFEARELPGTDNALSPMFSPDGRWLAFFADGQLRKIDITGAAVPAAICGCPYGAEVAASWAADGRIIYDAPAGLMLVSADGGRHDVLVPTTASVQYRAPVWLPGGRAVLAEAALIDGGGRIEVIDIASRDRSVLFEGRNPLFIPPDYLLFTRDRELLAARFSPDARRVDGTPRRLLSDIGRSTRGFAHFTLSAAGTLFYVPSTRTSDNRRLLLVDQRGNLEAMVLPPHRYVRPRVSPDGRRVVVETVEGSPHVIWIMDLERRVLTRLAAGRHEPTWAADGRYVTFSNGGILLRQIADGSAAEEVIANLEEPAANRSLAGTWSPDGRIFAFTIQAAESKQDILGFDAGGDRKIFTIVQSRFDERAPAFSPDGKWIAYVSDETGDDEVYVQPFPGPGPKARVSTGGGTEPVWARDGKQLFYRQRDRMMATTTGLPASFAAGPLVQLFAGRFDDWPQRAAYDVTADGRFLMVEHADEPLHGIRMIPNWLAEVAAAIDR